MEQQILYDPITAAELDVEDPTRCGRHQFLPGHLTVGELVPCPDGDHNHRVLTAVHAGVSISPASTP